MDLADITSTATSTTAVVHKRNSPLTQPATSPIVLCCVQMSFSFFFLRMLRMATRIASSYVYTPV